MLVKMASLHRAFETDRLVPCFQPLVELRNGRITGFEVLARWKHSSLGLILPANFISLAEQEGLATELMRQVFRKAFSAAQHFPEPPRLSVNVSAVQLSDLSLPQQIRDLAEDGLFPLNRLTVEITETALLNNLDQAKTILHGLKTMGCKLALDDFGTGYSNLSHLQSLPFDQLKIDRSFVAAMTDTRQSRKIVAAIVGLGRSLGLATVAEGVETVEQANTMLRLGCEGGQGWLYGRPVPAEGMAALIAVSPCLGLPVLSMRIADVNEVSSLEAFPAQRLAQLRAIYDGAPVGLCFLDTNLRYVSLNQRLADINGSPVESHLGHTVREMIGAACDKYEPYHRRALAGEAIGGVEVKRPGLMPGDPERITLVSYQPARDEFGEIIGLSVSLLDITQLKRSGLELIDQSESKTNKHSGESGAHLVRTSNRVA